MLSSHEPSGFVLGARPIVSCCAPDENVGNMNKPSTRNTSAASFRSTITPSLTDRQITRRASQKDCVEVVVVY